MESDEGRAKLLREARAHAAKYHRSPADPFVIRVLIFFFVVRRCLPCLQLLLLLLGEA